MTWFLFAFSSAIIFAWVTIIDKLMVDRNFADPFLYSLFIRAYELVCATIIVLATGGWQVLPLEIITAALGAGILNVGAGAIYFVSLTRGDASLVAAVEQTRPLLALVWGIWLLGELLSPTTYVGIAIVTLGTVLLAFQRDHANRSSITLNRIVPFMLLATLLQSLAFLSLKVAMRGANPQNGYFWQIVGELTAACTILLLWPEGRVRMREMLLKAKPCAYVGSMLNEVIASVGWLALNSALTVGTLAAVTALSATKPLFIGPFVWIANRLLPDSLARESSDQAVMPRWIIIVFIIIGTYFLSV